MRFRLEQRFQSSLAAVEAALLDPDFLTHQSGMAELGYPELLERVDDGDTVRQRVRYRFTGVLSPMVASFFNRERLTWVEESELDRRTHVQEFHIVPDQYHDRLQCTGTVALEEADGETVRVAEGELDVRVPLVGETLARTIVDGLLDHAAAQQQVVMEWLCMRYEQT